MISIPLLARVEFRNTNLIKSERKAAEESMVNHLNSNAQLKETSIRINLDGGQAYNDETGETIADIEHLEVAQIMKILKEG